MYELPRLWRWDASSRGVKESTCRCPLSLSGRGSLVSPAGAVATPPCYLLSTFSLTQNVTKLAVTKKRVDISAPSVASW